MVICVKNAKEGGGGVVKVAKKMDEDELMGVKAGKDERDWGNVG